MNKQTRWILTFILVLALSTLACQTLFGDDESETEVDQATIDQLVESQLPEDIVDDFDAIDAADEGDQPATEPEQEMPEDEQESEASADEEDGEDEASSDDQDNFFAAPKEADSYRIAFSMEIAVGEGEDATPVLSISGEGTVTKDPPASSLTFQLLGVEGADAFTDMTMVQIEDATYFTLPTGDCFSGLFGLDDIPFDDIIQGSDFAEGISDATLVERNVEINGINTDHYSFDPSDVGDSSLFDDSIQNFEGHLYVSDDGHLVRVAFSGDGGVDLSGLVPIEGGRVSYQLDYFDINEPIEVSVPEGCSEAGATDLPVVSDAIDLSAFGGITSYSSNLSFDEVVDFYHTEMAAAGWTVDQEFTIGTANNLTFSLDDAIVLVTIEEDSGTGQITVLIIEQ